jgi:hypothetical protein
MRKIILLAASLLAPVPSLAGTAEYEAALMQQLKACRQEEMKVQVGVSALTEIAGQYLEIVCHGRRLSREQINEAKELGVDVPEPKGHRTPEPRSGIVEWRFCAEAKDKLEWRMHDLVCSGQLDLQQAQREIAGDWQAGYRKYLR